MNTRNSLWTGALTAALAVLTSCDRAPSGETKAPAPPPVAAAGPKAELFGSEQGKTLFAANCAVCHGTEGKGDGPAAYLLWPRPRDFTRGKFKIRTTLTGGLPTDQDLLQVITNGMPGSSMPAWRHLPENQRLALVGQVKALSEFQDAEMASPFNHFREKPAGEAVSVPAEPPTTDQTIARGKSIYVEQGCVKCHGETGRADGPSAAELKDDWDQPIRPNDFTSGIFRGGSTNSDVYLRFATGMNGTPMPAYLEITDADRWALVHYVKSLSGDGPKNIEAALPTGSVLEAVKVESVALRPGDAAWEQIPSVTVPMALLFNRTTAPRLVRVRAAHDGTNIAFQLSWIDSSSQSAPLRPEDFRDAVAVEFALKGLDTPFMMGSADKPVNLWHWKADWQVDLGRYQDVEQIHPGIAIEQYPYEKDERTVANQGNRPSPMPDHDRDYQSGWAAGNPMSNPARKSPCEDCVAAGFGTLTSLPQPVQSIAGDGVWKDGRWTVVQSRSLAAPQKGCVEFKPGVEIPMAFAVWDGAAGDRAGQKSVTMWYRLVLK